MPEKISKIPDTKDQQKRYCRICFQEAEPLIKLPCNCKGSLSYIHNSCLSRMLKVKEEQKKEDVQDYIQIFSNNPIEEKVKAKCQICLNEILLEKQEALNWQKLMNVELQVYLVLFGISGISVFGLNIAIGLLERAFQETGIVWKGMYLAAYIWIIGVIFYVIFQPIYSEIKVINYKIQSQKCKKQKERVNWREKLKFFVERVLMSKKQCKKKENNLSGFKDNRDKIKPLQVKLRSSSKQKLRINRWEIQTQPKYYQI